MPATGHHPKIAIIDYGLGNLFSVKRACAYVGLTAEITSSKEVITRADVVILPGVGAFGDAMTELHHLDLVKPLQDIAASDKFLVGICLGQQLLMEESCEFGSHKGLGVIKGNVLKFDSPRENGIVLKVPQVCWNKINKARPDISPSTIPWDNTLLHEIPDGAYMYFLHSYYINPTDENIILSTTTYGNILFCSSLQYRNIFACQYHPERSGLQGLRIYRNLVQTLESKPI